MLSFFHPRLPKLQKGKKSCGVGINVLHHVPILSPIKILNNSVVSVGKDVHMFRGIC